MLVRKHVWVGGGCVYCGAVSWETIVQQHHLRNEVPPESDTRLCVKRDDSGDAQPEPKRRVYACEAWDEINARLREVQAEAVRIESAAAGADDTVCW